MFVPSTPARADTTDVITGNTAFALDLYGKLRTADGNLFFSPYSISTALAMTYGGAQGNTDKEMAQALHFNLPAKKLHPAFAALQAGLADIQQKGQVQLAVANSLWPQAGFALLPDYLALCQKNYHTSITPVDYIGHTEAARKTINDWVEARTNRKIVELLKPGVLDASTRLVLANAIYFKGKWAVQFNAGLTKNEPFHLSPKKTIPAPLMRQTGDFRYAEFPELQILVLPYAGDDLSMLVLLPRDVDGLTQLEARLTAQNLATWTARLPNERVDAFLPKFKMTSEFSLAGTLKKLGISDAFTYGRADFLRHGRPARFIHQRRHSPGLRRGQRGRHRSPPPPPL